MTWRPDLPVPATVHRHDRSLTAAHRIRSRLLLTHPAGHVAARPPTCSVEPARDASRKRVGRQGLEPWTYGLKVRSSTD